MAPTWAPFSVSAIAYGVVCLGGMRAEASGTGVIWVLALVADAVLCIVLASQVTIGSPPREPDPDCSPPARQLAHKQLARLSLDLQIDAELEESGGAEDHDLAVWRVDQAARLRQQLESCGHRPDPVDLCLAIDQDHALVELGKLQELVWHYQRTSDGRAAWFARTRYTLRRSLELCAQSRNREYDVPDCYMATGGSDCVHGRDL